jgi:hypothetical protein
MLSVHQSPTETSTPWDFLSIQTPFGGVVQRQFAHTLSDAETRLWTETEKVLLESRPALKVTESVVEPIPGPVLERDTGAEVLPESARIDEIQEPKETKVDIQEESINGEEATTEPLSESIAVEPKIPGILMPSLIFDLDED